MRCREAEPVEVVLEKKRTYDIQGEKLLGYYDDDVADKPPTSGKIFVPE